MSRFTKKPVTIEAWRNQESGALQPEWLRAAWASGTVTHGPTGSILIRTLEGVMRADIGDWIIQGVKGELYPCKPDIFAATYEAASAASKTIGLGLNMGAGRFESVPIHIPDGSGGVYKTELVLQRVPFVEKVNYWHGQDPRRDPHNHPWPFRSTILRGGYVETRWTKVEAGGQNVWEKNTYSYVAGDVNDMPAGVYHTVDSVMPGTVTHMVCGELVPGGLWGHLLDLEGPLPVGREVPAGKDVKFLRQMWALNPHMRPPGWTADIEDWRPSKQS